MFTRKTRNVDEAVPVADDVAAGWGSSILYTINSVLTRWSLDAPRPSDPSLEHHSPTSGGGGSRLSPPTQHLLVNFMYRGSSPPGLWSPTHAHMATTPHGHATLVHAYHDNMMRGKARIPFPRQCATYREVRADHVASPSAVKNHGAL